MCLVKDLAKINGFEIEFGLVFLLRGLKKYEYQDKKC